MFARFTGFQNRLKSRAGARHELTVENSGLTRQQTDTGRKALRILGLDSQSALTKQDLIIFLYAVGLNPTDDVIDSKLRLLRLHQHETVTFGQLCHIWHSMLQDLTDEEEILRRAFQFFDKDRNGEISITELRTTMHELGDLLTEEEIMAFMQVMDVNNDGVIGYQEFLATLKTQSPEMIGTDEFYFSQGPAAVQGPAAEQAQAAVNRQEAQAPQNQERAQQSPGPADTGRPQAVAEASRSPHRILELRPVHPSQQTNG